MAVLWIAWLLFRLCHGLRIASTPFKISLADIKSNGKLLASLFGGLKGESGFDGFLVLLRTRSLPIKHRFSSRIQFFDEPQRDQLTLFTEHIDKKFYPGDERLFNNIDLLLKFWKTDIDGYAGRLRELETFPKLRSLHRNTWQESLPASDTDRWDLIVNLMGTSSALLSTRELCSAISPKHIFPASNMHIWRIVDGECLRGLQTDSQMIKFIRKLLVPHRIDFMEMAGLGPIVRLLHLAAAIVYFNVLESAGTIGDSYPVLISSVRRVTSEFQAALMYGKNSIDKQDTELSLLYQKLFDNLQRIVGDPLKPFGDEVGLRILTQRLMKMSPSFDVSMAIISALSLLGSCPEANHDFLLSSIEGLLSSVSKHLIPRRSLYTLMMILANKRDERHTSTTFLIWKYLQVGSAALETILGINLSFFGQLAAVALYDSPRKFRSFIRKDIMKRIGGQDFKQLEDLLRLENPNREFSIDSGESILANINYLLAKYFLVDGTRDGRPVYLPMIQIHPLIEYGFWQLMQLALVYRIELHHFYFHPAYMRYTFSLPQAKKGAAEELVEAIIEEQFYSKGKDEGVVAEWVYELDMLQITQSFLSHIVGTSQRDYMVYQDLKRHPERTSVYKLWAKLVEEGGQEALRPKLAFFGGCVWSERQGVGWFTELLLRMSPNPQDINQILFETLPSS